MEGCNKNKSFLNLKDKKGLNILWSHLLIYTWGKCNLNGEQGFLPK